MSTSSQSMTMPEVDWQIDLDLSARSQYLLRSSVWADVEFDVGEDRDIIWAHRVILASASPVFASMFYGPLAEGHSAIRIPDVTPEIFKIMLEFIYTDTIESTTIDKLPGIDYVSKKYNIPRLVKGYAQAVIKTLCLENAVQSYKLAAAIEYQPLKDECGKIFSSHTSELLSSENLLHSNLNLEVLQFIFSLDHLSIQSELELLTAVEVYSKANVDMLMEADSKEHSILSLLQQIRFLSVPHDELAKQHRRLRKFLSEGQILSLMLNASCADIARMPSGFTTSRTSRNLSVPFIRAIVSEKYRIKGIVPENANCFGLNLQNTSFFPIEEAPHEGHHIMFHMSVRFYGRYVVVRNTFLRNWMQEERHGEMPFTRGQAFILEIEQDTSQYTVSVNGEEFCTFRHRLPGRPTHIYVYGDVKLARINY